MSLRNSLKSHIKVFGDEGFHTWNAGYDVNDDLPLHKIVRASKRVIEPGDILVIRDNQVVIEVEKVLGVFVIGTAVDMKLRDAKPYRLSGDGKTGKYVYGRIKINKAHLDKPKAP